MATSTTRRPEVPTSTDPHPLTWRARLIRLLALLAATAAAGGAGIVVAEQLTRSSAGAPGDHREPKADNQEVSGRTANRASSSAPKAHPQPGQEYVWRPAYVRGKVVMIRIRADAANVREDREISK
jgi:hypothetical protein